MSTNLQYKNSQYNGGTLNKVIMDFEISRKDEGKAFWKMKVNRKPGNSIKILRKRRPITNIKKIARAK